MSYENALWTTDVRRKIVRKISYFSRKFPKISLLADTVIQNTNFVKMYPNSDVIAKNSFMEQGV